MNTQQALQQAQIPAAPAAASPAPASPAAPEQLYDIQTPEGVRHEPLSVLQDRYVKHSDAERRLMESNARIAQLEQQNQGLAQRARFADDLNRELVDAPDALVARVERLARLAKGEGTAEDRASAQGQLQGGANVALEQMRAELAQFRGQLGQAQAVNEVKQALDAYPLFQNNETARHIAQTTLAAMRVASPNAPLPDLASKLHTQMVELVNKQANDRMQTRVERQGTMPPAPVGQTPGMTAPEPPPTVKDLRDGTVRRRLNALLSGPHGIQQ